MATPGTFTTFSVIRLMVSLRKLAPNDGAVAEIGSHWHLPYALWLVLAVPVSWPWLCLEWCGKGPSFQVNVLVLLLYFCAFTFNSLPRSALFLCVWFASGTHKAKWPFGDPIVIIQLFCPWCKFSFLKTIGNFDLLFIKWPVGFVLLNYWNMNILWART